MLYTNRRSVIVGIITNIKETYVSALTGLCLLAVQVEPDVGTWSDEGSVQLSLLGDVTVHKPWKTHCFELNLVLKARHYYDVNVGLYCVIHA